MGIVVVAALAATAVEGGNHGGPTQLFSTVSNFLTTRRRKLSLRAFTKLRFYANFSRHSHFLWELERDNRVSALHGGLNRAIKPPSGATRAAHGGGRKPPENPSNFDFRHR